MLGKHSKTELQPQPEANNTLTVWVYAQECLPCTAPCGSRKATLWTRFSPSLGFEDGTQVAKLVWQAGSPSEPSHQLSFVLFLCF